MNEYIKLSTMQYPMYIGDIESDPAGVDDYAPVEWVSPPNVDTSRYFVRQEQPQQQNGKWVTVWTVQEIPDQLQSKMIRQQRNLMLSETDWTQLEDSPVEKSVWAAYRQALRDVPTQSGFPWQINWPVKPE